MGTPSLARSIPTAARRTRAGWALSAAEQRAMVRVASSGVITPSARIHSTMWRHCTGPT